VAGVTVETHIDDAIERVDGEIDRFADRLSAVEAFERKLQDIPASAAAAGSPAATDGGVQVVSNAVGTSPREKRCREVRELFAETVYPHSASKGEEPLLKVIAEEFSKQASVALAPKTDQQFTPPVKRTLLSAAADRTAEIESMQRALRAERESLVEAREETRAVTEWLCEADQTPLLELDFEALRERHETLADFLQRCETLAQSRQEVIHSTTSQAGAAGVDHQQLVECLYQSFPVRHPALATTSNLEEVCRTSQRRVRDHLVRRI